MNWESNSDTFMGFSFFSTSGGYNAMFTHRFKLNHHPRCSSLIDLTVILTVYKMAIQLYGIPQRIENDWFPIHSFICHYLSKLKLWELWRLSLWIIIAAISNRHAMACWITISNLSEKCGIVSRLIAFSYLNNGKPNSSKIYFKLN